MQVNATMGPLQLSLVKMMRDILKFLFLFVLIYFAFTLALRKVYSQYVWARKSFLNQTASSPHGFSRYVGIFYRLENQCFVFGNVPKNAFFLFSVNSDISHS